MTTATQLDIPLDGAEAEDASDYWAESSGESRGEVFTRTEVVDFILDLTGWLIGKNLIEKRLLEPSCGSGDFVVRAIERLLQDSPHASAADLKFCISATEVNRKAYEELRRRVSSLLDAHGFAEEEVNQLCSHWLHNCDFLTQPFTTPFSHIVGNPPYLRLEALPKPLMQRYRSLYRTMYDRADLYIAFYEKALSLLSAKGKLGYICANRWTKNRYGGPLRELIAESYSLESYIDFTGVDAFHGDVIAYPAVTIIGKKRGFTDTSVVQKEDVDCKTLSNLANALIENLEDPRIRRIRQLTDGASPWLLSNAASLPVIRNLEERFPTLEEVGCKVGIGVATGADKVFIGSDEELAVENKRKLPLLTRKDLKNNIIEWKGSYVLNPFDGDSNSLIDPNDYPKFAAYLEKHRETIERRHVAKKNRYAWFKTIDRIYPSLVKAPKLLIPDIQGEPQIAYDKGEYYPHHNLYYVVSECWDLRALQTVLRSSLATAFVATYSPKMRGDCIRFQAQYLRRIRLPRWEDVSEAMQHDLTVLAESRSQVEIDNAVREIYGLDETDWQSLTEL